VIKTSNTVDKKRLLAYCEFPVTNGYVTLKSECFGFEEQTPIEMSFKAYYIFFVCLGGNKPHNNSLFALIPFPSNM